MLVEPRRLIAATATMGVVVGLTNVPYVYDVLLRAALCGVSLFLMLGPGAVRTEWKRWVLAALAVVHNPLWSVLGPNKDLWMLTNISTVGFFWFLALARSGRR